MTMIADTNKLGQTQMNVVIIVMVGNATTQMNTAGSNIIIKETEESYFVTKSDDGKWQFTCKICEATFASQKSVKQHITARHGEPGTLS